MAAAEQLADAFAAMPGDGIPGARMVADLEAALGVVRRLGGLVASETRTAPGIGSWVFVSDPFGREVLLWENAAAVG